MTLSAAPEIPINSPEIPVVKSKNQEKNDAKRLAKQSKFDAKKANEAKKMTEQIDKGNSLKKKKEATISEPIADYIEITPKGEKKVLSAEFPTTFVPKIVESAWYEWWEKCGFFKPETEGAENKEVFMIPMPPPNVTGALHLGHALTTSIQDCLTRWNRMCGKVTLFVPGADHAGIATQVVVEKKIMKERQLTRHDLGREAFLKEVFLWKDDYIGKIYNQFRRMGSSADWEHAKFTMDPDLCNAVNEAFVRLYDDGVIYRANRLVNWCTKLKTALSNLEVDSKELEGRTLLSVPDHNPLKKYEFGVLISFKYQIENSDEYIIVATTRLETMLGDTAIAVHPSDKRYKHLHGKFVIHPFQNRRIPIIADEYPDPEFGSGAVKITPAHDFNDYQVGQRNKLEFINIFTDDGKLNDAGAPFTGLQRFDAREAVLEALKEKGLFVKVEDNKMVLPMCGRSGNIVEPIMKPQWWVDCKDMAKQASDAVKDGRISIVPSVSEKEWFRWLDNIQDWCISRQLWWGHRVPAYLITIKGENPDNQETWVVGRSKEEALSRACEKYPNVDVSDISLQQDDDVLDTWFSSGLWPFSVLGWPEKTKDMELFFPNSLLETGWDILFFWVARMAMLSLKLTGKVPFKHVFCHAMVRDSHGRKMSKSLGNVIDPIDVIEGITLEKLQERLLSGNLDAAEVKRAQQGQLQDFPNGIPACGTDALRLTLLSYTSAGRDINLDILRIDGYRKFGNKMWNATRFVLMRLGDHFVPYESHNLLNGKESVPDLWILARLNKAAAEVNKNLAEMNFMAATAAAHQFFLYDLCDVYLEICKPVIEGNDEEAKAISKNVLYTCVESGIKMLHPFMPFITEELYQRLPRRPNDKIPTIMKSAYPQPNSKWDNDDVEVRFEFVRSIIRSGRSMMADYEIKKDATIYVHSSSSVLVDLLKSQNHIISSLIKGCKSLQILDANDSAPLGCVVSSLSSECSVYLLVKGVIDFDVEIQKLKDRQEVSKKSLVQWRLKTQIEGYETKIKQEVRDINAVKIKSLEVEIDTLCSALENFMKLKNE